MVTHSGDTPIKSLQFSVYHLRHVLKVYLSLFYRSSVSQDGVNNNNENVGGSTSHLGQPTDPSALLNNYATGLDTQTHLASNMTSNGNGNPQVTVMVQGQSQGEGQKAEKGQGQTPEKGHDQNGVERLAPRGGADDLALLARLDAANK